MLPKENESLIEFINIFAQHPSFCLFKSVAHRESPVGVIPVTKVGEVGLPVGGRALRWTSLEGRESYHLLGDGK